MRFSFLILVTLLFTAFPATAAKHALLIGVSDYRDDRIKDLEGPVHDVAAMHDVLTKKWNFADGNVVTLLNREATEENILGALTALHERSKPGDDLLVYYSGHGTSAHDKALGAKLHLPDGSGGLVTAEFNPDAHIARLKNNLPLNAANDGLIVGRYELKPLFEKLNVNRNLLVIFDACFSGNAVRGTAGRYVPKNKRLLSFVKIGSWLSELTSENDAGELKEDEERDLVQIVNEVSAFSYPNLVYFGAAAEHQLAVDLSQSEIDAGLVTTFDGKPHGGFTDALLRALWEVAPAEPQRISYGQLFNQVLAEFQASCKACGHVPVSLPVLGSDAHKILAKALFSTGVPNQGWTADPAAASPGVEFVNGVGVSATTAAVLAHVQGSTSAHVNRLNPDVVAETEGAGLQLRSADGALLKSFEHTPVPEEFEAWLKAQAWLKERRHKDKLQRKARLHAEFRHPLLGNIAKGGETVYFTVAPENDVSLILLLVDADGYFSVLHPSTEDEATRVFKGGALMRFPDDPDVQFKVTPPWGADNVLIYGVPPGAPALGEALSIAHAGPLATENDLIQRLTVSLDAKNADITVSHIRFLSVE